MGALWRGNELPVTGDVLREWVSTQQKGLTGDKLAERLRAWVSEAASPGHAACKVSDLQERFILTKPRYFHLENQAKIIVSLPRVVMGTK